MTPQTSEPDVSGDHRDLTDDLPDDLLDGPPSDLPEDLRIPPGIGQLRVSDVLLLLAAHRAGTISGAARELGTTPSQVSKAVARLERQLDVVLLARGARGIQLRDDGLRLLPALEEMVAAARRLEVGAETGRTLTVAAPAHLAAHLLPRIALSLPGVRLRGMDLSPSSLRAQLTSDLFEVCVCVGFDRLPASWSVSQVGTVALGLFGSVRLAEELGPGPVALRRLRDVPLIGPSNPADGNFGAEALPLGRGRVRGHEASSFLLALELAAATDQLVYGPLLAARPYVRAGVLAQIEVGGLRQSAPAYLGCRATSVLTREQRLMEASIRSAFEQALA